MFNFVKQWPLRKQIMTSFVSLSIILEMIILGIIYTSMQVTNNDVSDRIKTIVKNITEDNMNFIAREKGKLADHRKEVLGSNVFIIKYIFRDLMEFDVFKGYELFVPLTYEEMVASKTYPLTKNEMGEYVSYDKSVIWKENSKIEDTEEMKKFKNAASQLDRFFGSLFLNQMMKYIVKRFNLYYIYGDYKLISIWPGQKILNPNYKLEGENVKYESYWTYSKYVFNLAKGNDYPLPILNGPYGDAKTYQNPLCAIIALMMLNNQKDLRGVIQLELEQEFFHNYTQSLTFMKTGYGAFINVFGLVLGAPFKVWSEFSRNQSISLVNIYNRTFLTAQYFTDLANKTDNQKTLRPISILNKYYHYSNYYESTCLLPYDIKKTKSGKWEFAILLYVEKSEIDSIVDQLSVRISRNSKVIILFTAFLACLTLGFVIVCSFKVTMTISKPLKKMLKIADIINSNVADQQTIEEIADDIKNLQEGEYQLRDLIRSFKRFMGIMDDRKNKESKIIKKTCFYPLNQFHQQFVNTAKKGCSEINWHNLIESLQNDVEDEENDININENEFNINESINENLNLEDQTINE